MKSYALLLLFIVLVSFRMVRGGPVAQNDAINTIKRISDCFHDDLNASLKCVSEVSTPLYEDLKKVATNFSNEIQEHFQQWMNSMSG